MEYHKDVNTVYTDISAYRPNDYECERASNSYVMSVVAIMVGAPLPIVNLLATLFFFIANRKSTPYIKWHCTQALLSQITVFIMNTVAFTWTMRIIFGSLALTDDYIGYILTVICFNMLEVIMTISAAIRVRKGRHVQWWLWGTLTNYLSTNQIAVNK